MSSSDNELIDHDVFSQILDMDEEGDNEFSKSIVFNYFEQAENTFLEMDRALEKGDLPNLSRLGHFLKGSSAALGVKNVKIMCERIQHYGSLKDDSGSNPIDEKEAIKLITTCLETAKEEYYTANAYLKDFYDDDEEDEEVDVDEEEVNEEEEEDEEVEKDGKLEGYHESSDPDTPAKPNAKVGEDSDLQEDAKKTKDSDLSISDVQSAPEPTPSTA